MMFWDTEEEAIWGKRVGELKEFMATNGHALLVLELNAQKPKLVTWVYHQQCQYREHFLGKPCHIT